MEALIIQSVKVVFPNSEHHNKIVDVSIIDGRIDAISNSLAHIIEKEKTTRVVDGSNQVLAPAFFDLNVNFGEPGLETKEDMASGCDAAKAGGFSGLALQPNTFPALHSRSEISLIKSLNRESIVDVFPVGAISKDRKGEVLAELYDMQQNGAIAFSDGDKSLQQASLMSRALLYTKGFNGLILSYSDDTTISDKTKMNEGVVSTGLGMKGNPNLAEEVMVSRDLFLAEYNNSKIHFSTISTAGSVNLIREAKAKGIQVTADVAVHHLVLTDEKVESFDSNFKVKPPLRTEVDRLALLEGLKEGTIDAIVSQHTPHEIEYKDVEFEHAEFGITGLQTALPLLLKIGLSYDTIIEKLSFNPRKILSLALPLFEVGAKANFVLFNPNERWIFDEKTNLSKSSNSPYFNTELTGKVNLLINNNQLYIS